MLILLPLLMAYSLIGESIHEWLGITMFAVFILHHIINILKCGNHYPLYIAKNAIVHLSFICTIAFFFIL